MKDNDEQMLMSYTYHYRTQPGGDVNATNTENYVIITSYKNSPEYADYSAPESFLQSITYFDGLGRAKQSISAKAGGQGQDIILPIVYDGLGRQTKEYLPYVNTGQEIGMSSLNFIDNDGIITGGLPTYYSSKYPDDFGGSMINPYGEKLLEESPLNRVLKQGAPGEAWLVDPDSDLDHSIKMEYQTNDFSATEVSADNVRLFDVTHPLENTQNIQFTDLGFYASGELYKSIVKDENWTSGHDHTTEEFKNKLGQVILKRTYNEEERHDTYYVYDDFGNLTYVLPPEAIDELDDTGTIMAEILNELCYQYKYDSRNRLIEKKIPGKGWEYIVYDILDRPVLMQDTNLANEEHTQGFSNWVFTKYDIFGRVVYTGFYASRDDRQALQDQLTDDLESGTFPLFEERIASPILIGDEASSVYYSNNTFQNME